MWITQRRSATIVAAAAILATAVSGDVASAIPEPAWTWPIDGTAGVPPDVVRAFEPPEQPWSAGHRGVDIAGSDGEPVRAASSGTVTYAGLLTGIGVVTISHGPVRSTYQPVDTSVMVGERIQAGQLIGTLSKTGSHCAPSACLHWGLVQGETYLDPLSVLDSGDGPHLLPLGDEALLPHDAAPPPPMPTGNASLTGAAGIGALAGIAP